MIPKVMTPNDKFIRFSSFCIEHAPLLRNHRDFGELMQNVYDEIKVMEDILFEKMPCGHLARYSVSSDEGTSYCALCEMEAYQKMNRMKLLGHSPDEEDRRERTEK